MAFNEDYKWVMFDTYTVVEQVDLKTYTGNPATQKYFIEFIDNGNILINTANIQSVSQFYNKQTNRFENNRLVVGVGMSSINVIGSLDDFQSNYLPPDTTP
jgi:hypothetical protein